MTPVAVVAVIVVGVALAWLGFTLGKKKVPLKPDLARTLDIEAITTGTEPQPADPNENWLVGIGGSVYGRAFRVGDKTVTIGRAPDEGILLDDPAVSRKHCQVTPVDGALEVVDLDSHNGFEINDVATKKGRLSPGDELQIGTARFVFHRRGHFIEDPPLPPEKLRESAEQATIPEGKVNFDETISAALEEADGDLEKAAEKLGVDPEQLQAVVKKKAKKADESDETASSETSAE